TFHELIQYEQISLPEGTGMFEFIRKKAELVPSKLKIRIQVGNFETFCRMVEAKVGIGIMPHSAASRLRQLHEFSIIDLDEFWSLRKLQICARSFDKLPGFTQKLVTMLTAQTE
ncbi:LysR family transcriptional regulator, partial [Salmonella enterica]|nr:LysR family transcriptional regulator [Salmonella enterica]